MNLRELWEKACKEVDDEAENNPDSIYALIRFNEKLKYLYRLFPRAHDKKSKCKPHTVTKLVRTDENSFICGKCWCICYAFDSQISIDEAWIRRLRKRGRRHNQ